VAARAGLILDDDVVPPQLLSLGSMRRASASAPPPGGKGTTMEAGLGGRGAGEERAEQERREAGAEVIAGF